MILCMCSRNCIIIVNINIIMHVVVAVTCKNRQVIVTNLDCCWYREGNPQSTDYQSSCNARGKIGARGIEGDSGIVIEDACEDRMPNLVGGAGEG